MFFFLIVLALVPSALASSVSALAQPEASEAISLPGNSKIDEPISMGMCYVHDFASGPRAEFKANLM